MNPELWRRAGELFDAAVAQPPWRRRGFVEAACGDDQALRRLVERLLRDDGAAPGFLEAGVVSPGRTAAPGTAPPGERVGPYRLLALLGEGGMGTVYLAARDDGEYQRRVAVKLVRRDLVSDQTLDRFRTERQLLARLEHPGIARLYDGGTSGDGRPYLVMERVEGEPITRYCDRHRLPVGRRLELFLRACEAVDHAHRQGIVHRDLKPEHLLVTPEGEPKLLDFGIAKLLGPGAGGRDTHCATGPGGRRLTPRYASPEQIRGRAVTPATDVYALGVLLYELLTGRFPCPPESPLPSALEAAVCNREPDPASRAVLRRPRGSVWAAEEPEPGEAARARRARPGRLRRLLVGDLDRILARALEKEPGRRYASAGELAADLGRHLEGRPVQARPPTRVYRAGKLLRRHRGVAATAVLLLAVAAGGRMALERQREAEQGRAGALLELVAAAAPGEVNGDSPALQRQLEAGTRRIAELEERPALQAQVLATLGRLYRDEGLYRQARYLLERSLEVHRTRLDPAGREATIALHQLAVTESALGRRGEAEALFREGLTRRRELEGEAHPATAETEAALALLLWRAGDLDGAEALLRRSLATRGAACGPGNVMTAESLAHLGALLRERGAWVEAEALLAESLAVRRAALGADHPAVADSLDELAHLHLERGEHAAAEPLYRQALALRRRNLGAAHPAVTASLRSLARCLGEAGSYEEAEALFRQSLAGTPGGPGPDDPDHATTLNNLAVVLAYQRKHAEAEGLFRQVLRLRTRLLGAGHPRVGQVLYSLGGVRHDQGDLAGAEELYRRAEVILQRTLPPDHPARAYPHLARARLLLDRGEPAAAMALIQGVMPALAASHPPGHWRLAEAESLLGAAQARLGRSGEAARRLHRAHATLLARRGPRDPRTRRAAAWEAEAAGVPHPRVEASSTPTRG